MIGFIMNTASSATTWQGPLYAAVAVFLFSWSPILVRYASPMAPLEIAFGRLAVAGLGLLMLARATGVDLSLSRLDIRRFPVYGLIAALHFALFVASLGYTTIAHSLALVYTAPAFTTLFSKWWLAESIPRRGYAGITMAAVGIAVLTGFEPHASEEMLVGDLLALGSAVCYGLYSVAGRKERDNYTLIKYTTLVYCFGALWLLPAAAVSYSGYAGIESVLAIVALGIFPLAIGHTLYNLALRHTHATYVNLIATQEVTGGVVLGLLLLSEVPGLVALFGAAITLVGVGMVVTKQPTTTSSAARFRVDDT